MEPFSVLHCFPLFYWSFPWRNSTRLWTSTARHQKSTVRFAQVATQPACGLLRRGTRSPQLGLPRSQLNLPWAVPFSRYWRVSAKVGHQPQLTVPRDTWRKIGKVGSVATHSAQGHLEIFFEKVVSSKLNLPGNTWKNFRSWVLYLPAQLTLPGGTCKNFQSQVLDFCGFRRNSPCLETLVKIFKCGFQY